MPKRKIQFTQGNYYHLGNRGAGRRSIFCDEQDYLQAIRLMKRVSRQCKITFVAYCLLPNHYHWLIRQDGLIPANQLPKRVFSSYTRVFNHRHKRTGTLFEGRFHGICVDNDIYLRHLCRYIHCNPVVHGVADTLELWPYSNYPEWADQRAGMMVDRDLIRTHFGSGDNYASYVHAYLTGKVSLPKVLQQYLIEVEKT